MPRRTKKNPNGLGSKPVERGGSFTMLLTLGYKPDGSVFKKRVTASTEEEVLTRAKEIQVQYARGLLGQSSSLTFEEFAGQWLERQRRSVKAATIEAYTRELSYALAYIGKKRLTELKPAHVRAMLEGLSQYQTKKRKKALATRTQRHIMDRVHAVLQDALSLELVPRNVAEGQEVKAPPIEPVGIALEPEQQASLLHEAYKERHYFTLYLALTTGLRKGELLALRRDRDVDLKNRVIHVRETRDITVHPPKTRAALRSVPLSQSAVKAFEDWYARLERERSVAREAYQDSGFLLVDELGNPVHTDTPLQTLDRVIARLRGEEPPNKKHYTPKRKPKAQRPKREPVSPDFPLIRIHDLRHTCASNWLLGVYGSRIPVEIVSRWLGHSSPAVTMQVYAHVLKKVADEHAPLMHDIPSPAQSVQARATA